MILQIRNITLAQFEGMLSLHQQGVESKTLRKIDCVHLHHTWRPNHAQWRGQSTVEAMRRVHMEERHFSDIAQHLTIDPSGGLWTGRDWNLPPASARGGNGEGAKGPFMIEMVGDFDDGKDVLQGTQRSSVMDVVARILKVCKIETEIGTAVKPHCAFAEKTCPGTSLAKDGKSLDKSFLGEVDAARKAYTYPAAESIDSDALKRALPFAVSSSRAHDEQPLLSANWAGAEVPEDADVQERLDYYTRQRSSRGIRDTRPQWRELEPYVINIEQGRFSDDGDFEQDSRNFEDIFSRHIPDFFKGQVDPTTKRIMIHAHGGLVSEKSALEYAKQHYQWWLDNGIYPLYFVWETGFFDTLFDRLGIDKPAATRGLGDKVEEWLDEGLETVARGPFRWAWDEMKTNAWRANAPQLDHGGPGVAWLAAQRISTLKDNPEIHLVGHSTGAIFHAHLVAALPQTTQGMAVKTLSFLAPAITTELFKHTLCKIDKSKVTLSDLVKRLDLYTMDDARELADDCAKVYHKSLLYWVSRGFDSRLIDRNLAPEPLLGLQTSVRSDPTLNDEQGGLFKIDAKARVHWSSATSPYPRITDSCRHGCFDNDPDTMNSVMATIRGQSPIQGDSPSKNLLRPYPYTRNQNGDCDCTRKDKDRHLFATASQQSRSPANRARVSASSRRGVQRALCIGINAYAGDAALQGCVNDSQRWAKALGELGFRVDTLQDLDATRANIENGLRDLIQSSNAGDTVVFQYSAHGTKLPDLNGDEDDGLDEALVPVDHLDAGYVIDDDIAKLAELVKPGVCVTLIMDCCHSGSNSRAQLAAAQQATRNGKPRFLVATPQMKEVHRRTRTNARGSAGGLRQRGLPWIHLAACRDDEYAWESNGQGDFTAAAAPLLVKAVRDGMTPKEFMEQVIRDLPIKNRQHPLLFDTGSRYIDSVLLGIGDAGGEHDARPIRVSGESDRELLQEIEALAAKLRKRME